MIDFPLWLRIAHLINAIFLVLIIRSGIEILSAHPKLYLSDKSLEGSEWIRFTKKKMPKDRLWTSMDEEESFNSVVALPGGSNLGLGRHWHFFSAIFWFANGLIYVILLFGTGVWQTLIPTSSSIFPQAWNTILIYATGQLPPPGTPFDPAQQLAYAGVVFVLGPLSILSGAAMSPGFASTFPSYQKIFGGRQKARSFHFILMLLFILFIVTHLFFVIENRFQENMANIVYGGATMSLIEATIFFLAYFAVVILVNLLATEYSLKHARAVQDALGSVVEPVRHFLFRKAISKQHFAPKDISPYFRVNGRPPETLEYEELRANDFRDYRLKVHGLVKNPRDFSLEDLRKMKEEEQITEHYCIQGWTAVGEWAGVPISRILDICKPEPQAKYLVLHSFGKGELTPAGHGDPKREFYEVLDINEARRPQTILAYEMNFKPLPVEHGAPLRLRSETQLGYKMVKWVRSIEVVDDYSHIGDGHGGYREDVQHYGFGAEI